jgi:transposase
MKRPSYPSDLSDDEWELLKPLIPIHQGVGHPQTVEQARNCQCYFVLGR